MIILPSGSSVIIRARVLTTDQLVTLSFQQSSLNPDLVVRDGNGEIYSVRYDAVNAKLLNEFLKEQRSVEEQSRKVEKQEATIEELKSTVAQQQKDFQATAEQQQKQIEALTAGLPKVSAKIELNKAAPQAACLPLMALLESENKQ